MIDLYKVTENQPQSVEVFSGEMETNIWLMSAASEFTGSGFD